MSHLISLVALVFTLNAQTALPPIDGAWTVTVAAARDEADSGRKRSRNAITATMQLTVKGEEVTGTWTTGLDGRWPIKGTWNAGRLDLVSDTREISGTADGKKVSIPAHWIIRGAFKGDKLGGTCSMIFGSNDPLWSGWTATRSR